MGQLPGSSFEEEDNNTHSNKKMKNAYDIIVSSTAIENIVYDSGESNLTPIDTEEDNINWP
ncbi:hypothetical protein LguiA_020280 [Lonicera macranthoides]